MKWAQFRATINVHIEIVNNIDSRARTSVIDQYLLN